MLNKFIKHELFPAALLAAGIFVFHLLTAFFSVYGYFIDELYYIACSKRLAFGYVDHPPLSVFLLSVSRLFFGESIPAIRIFPALAAAATVFLTGCLTRELGGSRSSIFIASHASAAQPVLLLMGSFYSMNVYEPLVWLGILYTTVLMVKREDPRYWIVLGILLGLGLEIKHTMIVYAVALCAGLLLTSARKYFWNRWFVAGISFTAILVLPNIIWQMFNGMPSLEFYRNAMMNKNIPSDVIGILVDQIIFTNPFSIVLWVAGLAYFFFNSRGKQYRFFGWTYLFLLGVMITSHSSRPDRIAAIYPVLFAGGSILFEKLQHPLRRRTVQIVSCLLLVCGFVLAVPITTPLLSPALLKPYLASLGVSFSIEQGKKDDALPQWISDRLGWEELANDVAAVYNRLPKAEQQNACIITKNYGDAGALELYGKPLGLPPVYCVHNSYHRWGHPSDSVSVYIVVHFSKREFETKFERVEEGAMHTCADCSSPQRKIPIYVARNPKFSIEKEWTGFRIYN